MSQNKNNLVPINGFPLRSKRKFTGKSPSNIWHEIAARIPSFNMFVID